MENLIIQSYGKMKQLLHQIENGGGTALQIAENCFNIIIYQLSELKTKINPGILTGSSEIKFYKEMWPAFFKEIFYYFKLIEIETSKPLTEGIKQKQYYQQHLQDICQYLEQQHFLHTYYKNGKNYLDDILFTQPIVDKAGPTKSGQQPDTEFFNFNSYTIAKILASECLLSFINHQMRSEAEPFHGKLSIGTKPQKPSPVPSPEKNQRFNMENIDIKRKITWLETGIDLKTSLFYESISPVLQRKRKYSALLTLLKEKIQNQSK